MNRQCSRSGLRAGGVVDALVPIRSGDRLARRSHRQSRPPRLRPVRASHCPAFGAQTAGGSKTGVADECWSSRRHHGSPAEAAGPGAPVICRLMPGAQVSPTRVDPDQARIGIGPGCSGVADHVARRQRDRCRGASRLPATTPPTDAPVWVTMVLAAGLWAPMLVGMWMLSERVSRPRFVAAQLRRRIRPAVQAHRSRRDADRCACATRRGAPGLLAARARLAADLQPLRGSNATHAISTTRPTAVGLSVWSPSS